MSTPTPAPFTDSNQTPTRRPLRRYLAFAAVLVLVVLAAAATQMGVRYSWGGGDLDGPTNGIRDGGLADTFHDYENPGWDSSSLARFAVYKATGKTIARTCGPQSAGGHPVANRAAARPGDLVFFGGEGTAHHVGIYMGDGKMVNAPQPGSKVRVDDIDSLGDRPTFRRYT